MTVLDPSIAAADPCVSAWVAANAGAGKTHTLANRVTRLLLADARPARILCLTYTKAAAAEMQHRLFARLGEWSMQPDDVLRRNVADIGAEPSNLPKARRLFAQALETPGGLKILTIHAFCQNLLSRFPLEAGVPPSFDVLDDQTARELMADARARVLERAGSGDTHLAAALSFLVSNTSEAALNALLDAAMGADRRKLDRFFANLGDDLTALKRAMRQVHRGAEIGTAHDIVAAFSAELHRATDDLRALAAWLLTGGKTDSERGAALAQAAELGFSSDAYEHLNEMFMTASGTPFKSLITKSLVKTSPAMAEKLQQLADRFFAVEEQRRATHAAELAHAMLTIAQQVREQYARAKQARGALDYDDLIARTVQLLENGNAAQWVLYKLDNGIEHVLIDEAQDTSAEQWRIVRKLTEEFFAGKGAEKIIGPDKKPVVRTLFAVGDEKQSIFSFQGAEPTQFEENREHFQKLVEAAGGRFLPAPLIKSRRSVSQILKFVDQVFAPDSARAGLTFGNAEIEHDWVREETGRVEFWPALRPSDQSERDLWTVLRPVDVESSESPVVRLAQQIAAQIAAWIGKITLPGHKDPVRAGDIMVLLRRREPFGTEIIRRLKERNVPVAGADRMLLTDQIAVMDLMALGSFVLLPDDDLNLAALLRSPLCDVSEEDLFVLAHNRKGRLWHALECRKDDPAFTAAYAFLVDMRRRADYAPPYEFYAHTLEVCGLRLKLLKRLGGEANDAIDEFLSLSLTYEAANTPSLEGFLHWIQHGATEIKRDMERGRDEVRVMTVHGAKGLEADIVILPDTTTLPVPVPYSNFLYSDGMPLFPVRNQDAPDAVKEAKLAARARTLEEYRRLLYVALTRAKDRLIVCGSENIKGVDPNSWHALARAAAESLGVEVLRGRDTIRVFGKDAESAPTPSPEPVRTAAPLERPDWLTTRAPRDARAPRLIRPFDAAGMEEPATLSPFSENTRFRRGLLVHTLLARLPEVPATNRATLAREFLRMQKLSADAAEDIIRKTLTVINDITFAAAFEPGSRAEVAIVADLPELGPNARVNGRIDRLSVFGDRVLIVDFKTNRPPPTRQEDIGPLYLTQMALYRAAAQKIFPNRRIVCGLVWTDGPTLMELSNDLLEAELVRIPERLDPRGVHS
jgi:ATP-dependent helicase/nuclease subunit A